jgi:ornithine carbamoyltransferase
MITPPRHFLDLKDLPADTLRILIDLGRAMKRTGRGDLPKSVRMPPQPVLAMVFDKPSTRTRVSFDVAMRQLGGETIVLNSADMQLGRGETIADTARVLSRYVDAIMIRTGAHENLEELAEHAAVPVINGLTCRSHPCQVIADILTFEEHLGAIDGRAIAWIGDGNNVATSWIEAAVRLGFPLRLGCPAELSPDPDVIAWAKAQGGDVTLTDDPFAAARGASALVTDVWVSMGDVDPERREALLRPYQVNEALLAAADRNAIFMHCLPAHRGKEVTAELIDGPRSVVFDEAENRLHAQKAILAWALKGV